RSPRPPRTRGVARRRSRLLCHTVSSAFAIRLRVLPRELLRPKLEADDNAMSSPTILVATWLDGVFVVTPGGIAHEIPGEHVKYLTVGADHRPLAIVGEHALYRRESSGTWSRWMTLPAGPLACCVSAGTRVYLGTEDAQMLRVDADGGAEPLPG